MAQANKITLSLTPKQLEAFLEAYICKSVRKEAKKKLMTYKSTEKAQKSSKPDLKKQDSSTDLSKFKKMPASEVEALAKKKAKKEKGEIDCKGKKPTKAENIDYLTDGGNTTDTSKKDKKDKPESKELAKFCAKINNEKKLAKMELSELKAGAKLEGFAKHPVQDIRVVAVAMAKLQKVKIPNKGKAPTKPEYLAFATGKVKGVKAKEKGKEKEEKKCKGGKGRTSKSDPDSEEDSPSESESESSSSDSSSSSGSSSDSDSFPSCTDCSDSDSD